MRARFTWIAAALVSVASLALLAPACDGGGGGVDENGDKDDDGYAAKDDCDDLDASVHPGATEPCSCDGKDDDCNGKIDDFACALVCAPPNDSDGDGYEPPADCNDQDPTVHPGATEPCECDSIDQDCTGNPQDFACNLVCHYDKDNDSFRDAGDCDDGDGGINPNAAEKCECDTVDQNCNGSKTDLPDGCDVTCTDGDGDGYFAEGGDCDDADKDVHPDAMEPCECDAIDQDCSGNPIDFLCDLACLDNDNDGSLEGVDCDDNDPAAKPGPGPEPCACDGIDNDCNGMVDDFDAACVKTCTYLAGGDMCTEGMEPMCGAGLACCVGGAGGPASCVTECQGAMCDGKCPLVP